MKLQWRSISEEQENRFGAFRERKVQIEKDIYRTDRTHPFFEGDDNENVEMLQEILMTYVMYNFDLGYVQVIQFWIAIKILNQVKITFSQNTFVL